MNLHKLLFVDDSLIMPLSMAQLIRITRKFKLDISWHKTKVLVVEDL